VMWKCREKSKKKKQHLIECMCVCEKYHVKYTSLRATKGQTF